jgi:hypothetical protein
MRVEKTETALTERRAASPRHSWVGSVNIAQRLIGNDLNSNFITSTIA